MSITILTAVGLAAVVLTALGLSLGRGRTAADPLGSVSEQWIAEYRASHAENGSR